MPHFSTGQTLNVVRDTHRPALRAQNHQIRNRDGALALGDTALDLLTRIRARVALDHRDVFDQRLIRAWIDAKHASILALVAARDHTDLVIFLDLNAHRFGRFAPRRSHQITSGARETIFINLLSRSSRATGPNTRVPTGSPVSLISTAAFESNRI